MTNYKKMKMRKKELKKEKQCKQRKKNIFHS